MLSAGPKVAFSEQDQNPFLDSHLNIDLMAPWILLTEHLHIITIKNAGRWWGENLPLQACGLRVNASCAAPTFIALSIGCSRQYAALITQHPSFQSQSFSKTSKFLSAPAISAISAPGGTVNSFPSFQIQWMSLAMGWQ